LIAGVGLLVAQSESTLEGHKTFAFFHQHDIALKFELLESMVLARKYGTLVFSYVTTANENMILIP